MGPDRPAVMRGWSRAAGRSALREAGLRVLRLDRAPDGVEGIARLHALIADHVEDPAEVTIATETDRGLFVAALVAAGYRVVAVNPLSTSRYRERHSTSGAKSDPGDAKVLADLARTDAHNHRPVAGDSELAEAILTIAPTPEQGRRLSRSRIGAALRRGGRQRNLERRTVEIQTALRVEQLEAPPQVADAMGRVVASLVAIIAALQSQIDELETALTEHFETHPDAKLIRSLPGLGMILGARVLAEFGDDPNRYDDAKCRKNYAGTSPITRASGKHRVVLARYARNRRLADACYLWAFASITVSPGARTYYDQRRAAGDTHHRTLRALANRLVGVLHGCLRHQTPYDEHLAWGHRLTLAA